MKKILIVIQSFFIFPFFASPAFAQVIDPCIDAVTANTTLIGKTLCGLGGDNIGRTIGNIAIAVTVIAIVITLAYLIYGGIKWITSGGDKEQVEGARKHIIAAIVGLVVVFLSIFILTIILGIFGIKLNTLAIPNIAP